MGHAAEQGEQRTNSPQFSKAPRQSGHASQSIEERAVDDSADRKSGCTLITVFMDISISVAT
jgi:hypothetical protein